MTKRDKDLIIKKERRFHITLSLKFLLKILLVIILIICLYLIFFHYKAVEIYLTRPDNRYEQILFTVMIGCSLLLYMLACGFHLTLKSKLWKILFFGVIIYFMIQGFMNIGYGIIFHRNFGLLNYIKYESDSYKGMKFFIFNYMWFFFILFVMSLAFRQERK